MAIIHKCDRCGKAIPKNQDIPRSFIHRQVVLGRILFDLSVGNGPDEYEADIELCKECNESFVDWFNAGESMRKLKKNG